jgi:hypothetical protein
MRLSVPSISVPFAAALWISGCAAPVQTPASAPKDEAAAAAAKSPAVKPPVTTPGPIEVVSAQFGVFGADPTGRRVLYETAKFPAVISAPYGWYIVFKTEKPTVIWREEFELPVPPPTWGPGEAMGIYTISPDRKTAVTERIIPTRLGFIANEWRYAPGDPIGSHKMRIYIDGQLIREFSFDIEEGPEDQRVPRRGPGRPGEPGSST